MDDEVSMEPEKLAAQATGEIDSSSNGRVLPINPCANYDNASGGSCQVRLYTRVGNPTPAHRKQQWYTALRAQSRTDYVRRCRNWKARIWNMDLLELFNRESGSFDRSLCITSRMAATHQSRPDGAIKHPL